MTDYTLSQAADDDLTEIYRFTFAEFGETQADAYFASLEQCIKRLAEHPELGIDISNIREDYRRFVHKRHTIFYKNKKSGVYVVRVLGPGMSIEKNLP